MLTNMKKGKTLAEIPVPEPEELANVHADDDQDEDWLFMKTFNKQEFCKQKKRHDLACAERPPKGVKHTM